jgi:hypothetical protein
MTIFMMLVDGAFEGAIEAIFDGKGGWNQAQPAPGKGGWENALPTDGKAGW